MKAAGFERKKVTRKVWVWFWVFLVGFLFFKSENLHFAVQM